MKLVDFLYKFGVILSQTGAWCQNQANIFSKDELNVFLGGGGAVVVNIHLALMRFPHLVFWNRTWRPGSLSLCFLLSFQEVALSPFPSA